MFGDIGSIIILSFLSLAGVSPAEIPTVPAVISCESQPANTCLNNDVCDVFVSSGGESCALACDLRDLASCESDGACAVQNGVCDYPDSNPVGC